MELLAIICGLQFCVPLGISSLVVESDSLLAIQAVIDDENFCAKYSNVVREILSLCQYFNSCSFCHVTEDLVMLLHINLRDMCGKLTIFAFGGM